MKIKDARPLSAEEYLEISRDDCRRAVDRIMKEFAFNKAAAALRGCRWRFVGATRSPNADELRVIARKILMQVIQSGSGCACGQGPLEATTRHWGHKAVLTAELMLKPVWKSAVYIDGRVIFANREKFTSGKKQKQDQEPKR